MNSATPVYIFLPLFKLNPQCAFSVPLISIAKMSTKAFWTIFFPNATQS